MCSSTIREALDTHGDRYLRRVYTDNEVRECMSGGRVDARRLAACFAAKEATLKALRVGDDAIAWRDMEVRRAPAGGYVLSLSGAAAEAGRRQGLSHVSLSVSANRDTTAAVVIADMRSSADR